MRYWRPAGELAPLVSGYHLYAVAPAGGERQSDVFQPSWPALRFTFGNGDWCIRQPGDPWRPVPSRSLFGPSSRIRWSESGPGLVVGIGLRPCGWARFTTAMAYDWADRVGDPDGVFHFDVSALQRQLAASAFDAEIPHIFDAFLLARLGEDDGSGELIARVEAALLAPELGTVTALAERIGISARSLERLTRRAFGFTPKLLMRRARFLRSLHAVAQEQGASSAAAIDPAYTDYSHFVRDAQHFLGMSPQAFLKLDAPLLRQSLTLRRQVLGAPAQALASDAAE